MMKCLYVADNLEPRGHYTKPYGQCEKVWAGQKKGRMLHWTSSHLVFPVCCIFCVLVSFCCCMMVGSFVLHRCWRNQYLVNWVFGCVCVVSVCVAAPWCSPSLAQSNKPCSWVRHLDDYASAPVSAARTQHAYSNTIHPPLVTGPNFQVASSLSLQQFTVIVLCVFVCVLVTVESKDKNCENDIHPLIRWSVHNYISMHPSGYQCIKMLVFYFFLRGSSTGAIWNLLCMRSNEMIGPFLEFAAILSRQCAKRIWKRTLTTMIFFCFQVQDKNCVMIQVKVSGDLLFTYFAGGYVQRFGWDQSRVSHVTGWQKKRMRVWCKKMHKDEISHPFLRFQIQNESFIGRVSLAFFAPLWQEKPKEVEEATKVPEAVETPLDPAEKKRLAGS